MSSITPDLPQPPGSAQDIDRNAFQNFLMEQLSQQDSDAAFTEAASRFLQLPLTVCDPAYTVIASWPEKADERVFALQQGRQIMRVEIISELQHKGIVRSLRTEEKPIFTLPRSAGWEFFCPIRVRGQMIGYVYVLLTPIAQPSAQAMKFLPMFAQAMAIQLQKSSHPVQPAQPDGCEYLLRQLVEGAFQDEELLLSRLKQYAWAPSDAYRISCIFSPERALFATQDPQTLFRQIRYALPGSLCFANREHLVLLTSAAQPTESHIGERLRIQNLLRDYGFCLVTSNPISNLLDTPHAYTQAKELMDVMLHAKDTPLCRPEQPLLYYERSLPICTFLRCHGTAEEPVKLLHPHIQCLLEYDRRNGTTYIATLRAYFASNRSTTLTSEALFIHKTTFFYRIRCIEEILRKNFGEQNLLKNQELLFLYEYSLRILDVLLR